MSSDPLISLRGVSKAYRLYRRRSERLRQVLFRRFGKSYGTESWALKNVSFDVRKGECVGIIGRNGSGKSTLLQVVAGILRPTSGSVAVHGRVAALLELGTGFDPEFTGRENVYLNAALFGIPRQEMARRFDEVADFAGIGGYMDQPVKFYSSGMAVRLAFAVQVTVPKQVLIVDEALSVGDEAFQRRCIRAIEQFLETGGTVLFVSHSLRTVARLCGRCLLLVEGDLLADGEPKPVMDLYQKLLYSEPSGRAHTLEEVRARGWRGALSRSLPEPAGGSSNRTVGTGDPVTQGNTPDTGPAWHDDDLRSPGEVSYGDGGARITTIAFHESNGRRVNVMVCGLPYELRYSVEFLRSVPSVGFGMSITTPDGIPVAGDFTPWHIPPVTDVAAGSRVGVRFPLRMNLAPGTYFLNTSVASLQEAERIFLHRRVDVLAFRVVDPSGRLGAGLAYLASECPLVEVLPPENDRVAVSRPPIATAVPRVPRLE